MRASWRLILIALAALSLALAVEAPAEEGDEVRTTVLFHELTAGSARGKVLAREKECEDGRTITLFRVVGGGSPPVRVAHIKTIKSGIWVTHTPFAPGDYYAVATHQRKGEFDCRADVSPRRTLPAAV